MQVFNRHVSGKGLTVFSFETVLISVADARGGPGARVARLGARRALENRTRHGGLRALLLLQRSVRSDGRPLRSRTADARDARSRDGRDRARRLSIARARRSTSATASSSRRVGCCSSPSRVADGLRRPHTRSRTSRSACSSSARDPSRGSSPARSRRSTTSRYRIVGYVTESARCRHGRTRPAAARQRRPTSRGWSCCTRSIASSSSLSDRRGHLPIQELLRAKLSGVRIEDAATTYERISGKILTDGLAPSWFIFSDGFRAPPRATRVVKRLIDIALAAVGLVLAAPLMLLTAIAVWLDSPGPIFYRQDRVGENDRLFTLCKFRSMRIDAEKGTPIWATNNDSRVTRVGRFIRLTRLDELPQLLNVLRGDMSFVGPRPERPYFVQQLTAADSVLCRAPYRQARRHRLGAGPLPLRLVRRRRDGETAVRPLLHQASLDRVRPDDRHRHRQGDLCAKGAQ